LRAYLLRLVSGSSLHALRTEVASAWTEIDRRKPDRVNAALRAYYGSVQGVRAPKVDVFDAFARDIFSQSEYATLNDSEARTVKKQVVAIRDAVILFDEKLLAGEWPYPKTKTGASDWERHLLERVVVRLKSQRALPLLLAAASIWKDEQSFTRLMRLVERAEVRFLIANAHQSTVADRYFEAAKQVRSGADVVAIESLLEPWVAALADDVSFRAGLNGLNYKRRSVRIRHLLAMLEDYRPSYLRSKRRGNAEKPKANELRNWNLSAVDIDHVYPQHPPSGGTPKLDELKHQLGNLTLLLDSDNRELAKNLLPWDPAKIAIYKESHVRLTEALGKQIEKTGWDADRLADHQKELVAMAEFVYQVSPAAKTAAKSIS
jgi:hypothetical protein